MMPVYPEAFMPGTSQSQAYLAATPVRVQLSANGPIVRLYNNGPSPIFVAFGDSTITATQDVSIGIPAQGVEILRLPDNTVSQSPANPWYIGMVSVGAGNLNIQTGFGV